MENKKPWFNFMASNEWKVFMNIMRVLTLVALVFIIVYVVMEVEAIKLLGLDPCKICMEGTGCNCYCFNP